MPEKNEDMEIVDEEEDLEEPEEKKKKISWDTFKVYDLNLLLVAVIIILQIAVGMFAIRHLVFKDALLSKENFFAILKKPVADSLRNYQKKMLEKREKQEEKAKDQSLGPIVELENEIIINPKNTYAIRFMVMQVAFELTDKIKPAKLDQWQPIIRDKIIELLMTKRMDFYTDPKNIVVLKTEIKQLVEGLLGEDTIKAVYFPKFVLQ